MFMFILGMITGIIFSFFCAHLGIRHQEAEKARYEELGKMLDQARKGNI